MNVAKLHVCGSSRNWVEVVYLPGDPREEEGRWNDLRKMRNVNIRVCY